MLELSHLQIYTLIGMVIGISVIVSIYHLRYLTSINPRSFGAFIAILLFTFLWPIMILFMAITRPIPHKEV